MARKNRTGLAQHGGQYTTDLGYALAQSGNGLVRRQPRFYLGSDEGEAILRSARLEKLWQCVSHSHIDFGYGPTWVEPAITIAKHIAKGHTEIALQRAETETDEQYFTRIQDYRKSYGSVSFDVLIHSLHRCRAV
jgi:hypothetical protein